MTDKIGLNDDGVSRLKAFIALNKGINFRTFNFFNEDEPGRLIWSGIEKNREEIIGLLKGYQRLIRIIPEDKEETAFLLLKSGLHSALQICSMSRKEFMKRISENIQGDIKTAEQIYTNAQEKKGVILLQYMNMLQNSEPHISAAKFN